MSNPEPSVPHVHDPVGVQRLKNWHEHLADFILLNPTAKNAEIAAEFDVTENSISRVRNSDLFKMYFEKRKQSFYEKVDATAVERINRKLNGLTERAIDVLAEKIEAERLAIGIGEVRETVDMALKAVGYGTAPAKAASQVQVNVLVDRSALADARELHAQRREALTELAPQGAAARSDSPLIEPRSDAVSRTRDNAPSAEEIDL